MGAIEAVMYPHVTLQLTEAALLFLDRNHGSEVFHLLVFDSFYPSAGYGQQEVMSVIGDAVWHSSCSSSLGKWAVISTHATALMGAQEVETP